MTKSRSAIDTLITAATLAPSGDNTQPWRFSVDRDRWTISIEVDPARDPSPMNAKQRMAWIAIGAAIENVVQTADRNGWKYEIGQLSANASLLISIEPSSDEGSIDPLVEARVTNRRPYDQTPITVEVLERLQSATFDQDGVAANWFTHRSEISRLSEMIAVADSLILGTKPVRDAFLAKVRFDQPFNAIVDSGLSLGSLEVSGVERRLLKAMRYVPDGLLRTLGGRSVFAGVAKKLASSASGICVIGSKEDTLASCVDVGRVWQRAWLALTQEGLAAQPMMSLCVLAGIQEHGSQQLIDQIGRTRSESVLREFDEWFLEHGSGRPAAIMRFGFAQPPTTRTGRLPVSSTMTPDALTSRATKPGSPDRKLS